MATAALALALLLGTVALPPEQAHVAHAAIHIALDVGVASATVHRSTSVMVEPAPAPR